MHANAQEVIVGVTDTGPGIRQDDVSVIFERFKQVGNQVQASGKGFGLGLNIARELVHLNLGTMQVESELGRGSTFSFTLPTAEPLRLFDRYLDCVLAHAGASPAFSSTVSLLTAQIEDNGDAQALAAADGFLQTVVGSYDLVYRVEPRHWALAVRCPADELGPLMQRILREWTELGENRPAGALPELRLQSLGSWRADRRRAEVASAFAALAAEIAPHCAPKRVLLVDDDNDVIETLGIRLRAAGYEVCAARDGRQGVACAIQDRPDVIVLDVRMPVQDGISALGELKQREDTRRIPVIMLSASIGHHRKSKELGARFFIQKPYDASAVMSAVQSSLSEACLA
jgi:CheY-like chemotaxis protein